MVIGVAVPAWSELVARIGAATLLGALIGFEREWRGQLAGMRTHALVAAGAALFTIVGAYGFPDIDRTAAVDPMRVAAQVVSGIGFIGAGAILRDGGSVRGVTTAAGLWASAGLGLATGSGLYAAALVGTATVLVALVGLRLFREHATGSIISGVQAVEVTYEPGYGTMAQIVSAARSGGGKIDDLDIEDLPDGRHVHVAIRARNLDAVRQSFSDLSDLLEVKRVRFLDVGQM